MVPWRFGLILAMLLLPVKSNAAYENSDEDEMFDNISSNDDGDSSKNAEDNLLAVPTMAEPTPFTVTRTTLQQPIECYVCSTKSDLQRKSCLDPTLFKVNTMSCQNVGDKCTTVLADRGSSFEYVMRGCRSQCVENAHTKCCDLDRCNNQSVSMLEPKRRVHTSNLVYSNSKSTIPPSVLYFVTILLLLQSVVKVTLV